MKRTILYISIGIATGLIIGYFGIPRVPDVKVVTETRIITKTVQVNKNTVTDREIIKYKDGTEKIVEKIVDRDVIQEKEVVKEKIVDKTVYQTAALGAGVNLLNLNEPCILGEIQLIGPIWVGNILTVNIKSWEVKSFLFVSVNF